MRLPEYKQVQSDNQLDWLDQLDLKTQFLKIVPKGPIYQKEPNVMKHQIKDSIFDSVYFGKLIADTLFSGLLALG